MGLREDARCLHSRAAGLVRLSRQPRRHRAHECDRPRNDHDGEFLRGLSARLDQGVQQAEEAPDVHQQLADLLPSPRRSESKRSHIAGMNLGWFLIDQAEECELKHWIQLCGRLRRPQARKRFGWLTANPSGKDWIYQLFGFGAPAARRINEWTEVFEKGELCGIAVHSDENRRSNGGFVDDNYFEGLRQHMPPEWVARFLD